MKKTQRSSLYRNKQWLYNQYVEGHLTCEVMASLCNCHPRTIHQWLINHNIPRRRRGYEVLSEGVRLRKSFLAKTDPRIIAGLKKAQIASKTPEALRKLSFYRGANNRNWKGGASLLRALMFSRIEYKLWRTSIFERDSYTCQVCGQHGRDLQAHHIVPVCVNKGLVLNKDNGVTLCVACHRKMPKKKATEGLLGAKSSAII